MDSMQIDSVCPRSDIYPFIVNFQNGYPTEKFKTGCMLLCEEETNTKTIAADVENTLYIGQEAEEALGKTLILARSKRTGRFRLIDVGNIELKPVIRDDLDSSQLLDNSALELGRKFGSKKYKKQLEQTEKLKQNEQAVVAQMANVTQNLTQDQLDVSTETSGQSDNYYIPPINRQASTITEVYDLDAILTPEQYDSIATEIQEVDLNETLCPVIKGLIKPDWTSKQKVLAVYANSLYNIYFLKATDIMKKAYIACYESQTLNDHILETFFTYVNGKRCRPIHCRDKTLIHTMVFMLLINNLRFNFEEFCKDVKNSVKAMTTKLSITGAQIVAVNGVKMAQLKLPLQKPSLRRKSGKF